MNTLILDFRGEFAALGAAFIWAMASFIYIGIGKRIPPLILNFAKSGIAIALIFITVLIRGDGAPVMPTGSLALLLLSGAIGIGVGDTAFFESLNCLGARRSLLLEALSPPLAALLALVFLGEQLSVSAWMGIGLTIAGVVWVVVERTPETLKGTSRPLRGISFGLLAALGQASGAVMSRAALATTEVSPLWSTLARLIAGVVMLGLWIGVRRQSWQWFQPLQSVRMVSILIGASFFSTYLAIWLQQTALKYAATGIAQSLSATSPLFVLPVAIWLGDRVSIRAIVGVLVALGGVWLLFDFG
ncbi:DMT family transporter [Oculatella sp. LEGE 06141]|uniref:DMT family transporter n=1 Tax=Oculatella sp. LEGE 06141 TaxID=1828648 RepID=UPI0030DAB983